MAEKIILAELDFDVDGVIKRSAELKKQSQDLKKEIKSLKDSEEDNTEELVKLEASLKNVNNEYRVNSKLVQNLEEETGQFVSVEMALNRAVNEQVNSINSARKSNKELLAIRNELNLNTKEGIDAAEQINQKIDDNNAFIKENVSAYEQQKIGIGDYKTAIVEALNETNRFGGAFSGFTGQIQRFAPAFEIVRKEFEIVRNTTVSSTKETAKLTKAQKAQAIVQGVVTKGLKLLRLALISTGIGAIAVILGSVIVALQRSEKATAKLRKAFSGISGIVSKLLSFLEPLGNFILDGLVVGFELLEVAISEALKGIATALDFLGFDEAATNVRDFNKSLEEGAQTAKDLAQAEEDLANAQRKARLTQLEFQKDAEKLRQIRDDEALSINERIKANEELGVVLQKQLAEELKIAQIALDVANLRLKNEGETTDALDAQADALTEIADIQERITGQESEQLTNINSLRRDAEQQRKDALKERERQLKVESKLREAAVKGQIDQSKILIEQLKEQNSVTAKSTAEQLEFQQELRDKKLKLLEQENQAYLSSERFKSDTAEERVAKELQLDLEKQKIQNDFFKAQAEAAVEVGQRELEAFQASNQSRLEGNQFLSDELVSQELERIEAIENAQLSQQKLRLDQGLINEQEFQDQITTINQNAQSERDSIEEQREAQRAAKRVADFQNELEIRRLQGESEFQLELEELERKRLAQIENAKLTGADLLAINENFALRREEIEKKIRKNELRNAQDFFGSISNLLGEFAAESKEIAIAQALIDASLAVTRILAAPTTIPEPFGSIAKVAQSIAVGARAKKQVQEIAKAEKGAVINSKNPTGIFGGRSHKQGGNVLYDSSGNPVIETERDEPVVVLNKRTKHMFGHLNWMNTSTGGANLMAQTSYARMGGTIVGRASNTNPNINLDELVSKMTESLSALPNPVVGVMDINTAQVKVVEEAAFGNI